VVVVLIKWVKPNLKWMSGFRVGQPTLLPLLGLERLNDTVAAQLSLIYNTFLMAGGISRGSSEMHSSMHYCAALYYTASGENSATIFKKLF